MIEYGTVAGRLLQKKIGHYPYQLVAYDIVVLMNSTTDRYCTGKYVWHFANTSLNSCRPSMTTSMYYNLTGPKALKFLIAIEFFILQVFRVNFYVSTFIHLIGLSQSDLSLYGLGA